MPKRCQEFRGIKLKHHQLEVSEYLSRPGVKGVIAFHYMGSGKTITALTVSRCLYDKMKNIFIIIPGAVMGGFEREISRTPEFASLSDKLKLFTYGKFLNYIAKHPGACKESLLIVDEAQNFRNPGNETMRMILAFLRAEKTLVLSGTPLQNSPTDLISLLCMVDPRGHEFSSSISDAKKFYTLISREFNSALGEMPKSRAKMHKVLAGKISYFRTNIDRDPHYPKSRIKWEYVTMTPEYAREYDIVEANEVSKLPGDLRKIDLTVFYNGLRRAANRVREVSPKITSILKLIRKILSKSRGKSASKIVLYSNWQDSGINIIRDELASRGIKSVSVSGEESVTTKAKNVKAYNSGEVRVMLITKAGAAGLDLKGTRVLIIMEPHWNDELIKQVIGRAARYDSHAGLPKSKRRVTIYRYILLKPNNSSRNIKPSIDEIMQKIADEKNQQILDFYKVMKREAIKILKPGI